MLRFSNPWNDKYRSLLSVPKISSAFLRVSWKIMYSNCSLILWLMNQLDIQLHRFSTVKTIPQRFTSRVCFLAFSSLMLARNALNCSYDRRLLYCSIFQSISNLITMKSIELEIIRPTWPDERTPFHQFEESALHKFTMHKMLTFKCQKVIQHSIRVFKDWCQLQLLYWKYRQFNLKQEWGWVW